MGWNLFPPTAGQAYTLWDVLIEPRWALQEKYKALGNGSWPMSGVIVWDSGTIDNASMNSDGNIVLSMPTTPSWGVGDPCCAPGQLRWVEYNCNNCGCPLCYIPIRYDIVIVLDPRDPLTQVRGHIIAQTVNGDSGTLTISGRDVKDLITAKFIDSVDQLNGQDYVIIKQSAPWLAERLPIKPGDPEQWNGDCNGSNGYYPPDDHTDPVTGVVTHTGPEYTILTDANTLKPPGWTTDQWLDDGVEVRVFGSNGLLSLPILHNDGNALYVTKQTGGQPSGPYFIVAPGDRSMPGRERYQPLQWYYGSANFQAGHQVDDTLATANTPAPTAHWSVGNPCSLEGHCTTGEGGEDPDPIVQCFDVDCQKPWDFEAICICGSAGDFINPKLHWSYRQLQNDILEVAGAFVRKGYDGGGPPNTYTQATLFYDAGINCGTSQVSYQSDGTDDNGDEYGHYYFNASNYAGIGIVFSTEHHNGTTDQGTTSATPDTSGNVTISAYGNRPQTQDPNAPTNSDPIVGRKVYYSAGWTRYRPRWFKYFYPKTSFIPDIVTLTEGGSPQVADPPISLTDDDPDSANYGKYTCEGIGMYEARGKSSAGCVASDRGVLQDSAEQFVTGQLYRYFGDEYTQFPGGPLNDGSTGALLTPYYDKFYRGRLNDQNQLGRDASRAGNVTRGSKSSLQDTDKNWWADWCNNGTFGSSSQSGTATSGSTTQLKDSTRNTEDANNIVGCWWRDNSYSGGGRFPTDAPYNGQAYVGFILEVDQQRSVPDPTSTTVPPAVIQQTQTFKAPITSTQHGATGVTINFDSFEIPKYNADGTWTTETFTVHQHDAWRIYEPRYEVNKWRDRKVVINYGDGVKSDPILITHSDRDTIWFTPQSEAIPATATYEIQEALCGGTYRWNGSEMVPVTGTKDVTADEQGWVKDYGHVHLGDCMRPVSLYKEVYDTLNLLKKTPANFGWVHTTDENEDPNNPEKNAAGYGGRDQTDGPGYLSSDADLALYNNRGYGSPAGENNVIKDGDWEKNYSCNSCSDCEAKGYGEGIREQLFDYGDPFDPDYNTFMSDGPPMRTFGITGHAYGYHGVDPSGNYLNQPYMIVEIGDFSIDTTFARYAYGKATGIPTILSGSLSMYVYCVIDEPDHDEGSTVTKQETATSGFYSDQTYTFFGATGASFREWTLYGTAQPDNRGIAYGPKFGDVDGFEIFQGTYEGCDNGCGPDNQADCHLESDFPTDFDAPDGFMQQVQGMSHAAGSSYYWVKVEYKGYIVKQTAAVMDWDMEFMA